MRVFHVIFCILALARAQKFSLNPEVLEANAANDCH